MSLARVVPAIAARQVSVRTASRLLLRTSRVEQDEIHVRRLGRAMHLVEPRTERQPRPRPIDEDIEGSEPAGLAALERQARASVARPGIVRYRALPSIGTCRCA